MASDGTAIGLDNRERNLHEGTSFMGPSSTFLYFGLRCTTITCNTPIKLRLPVRPEQIFILLIATGECAVMCMMQSFPDAPCQVGVGRGDDDSFRCFYLIRNFDNARQGMFSLGASLFILSKPDNLVPM